MAWETSLETATRHSPWLHIAVPGEGSIVEGHYVPPDSQIEGAQQVGLIKRSVSAACVGCPSWLVPYATEPAACISAALDSSVFASAHSVSGHHPAYIIMT
jgi:hypothetical protein